MTEYNKGISKESDVEIRELHDTEVPDRLKPFYMINMLYFQLWKVDCLTESESFIGSEIDREAKYIIVIMV